MAFLNGTNRMGRAVMTSFPLPFLPEKFDSSSVWLKTLLLVGLELWGPRLGTKSSVGALDSRQKESPLNHTTNHQSPITHHQTKTTSSFEPLVWALNFPGPCRRIRIDEPVISYTRDGFKVPICAKIETGPRRFYPSFLARRFTSFSRV